MKKKNETLTGRHIYYSMGGDNRSFCVCVVFSPALTHMLMSEALRQKKSCDGGTAGPAAVSIENPSS